MNPKLDISNPAQFINALFEERRNWSDDQILSELKALPVLPDENVFMESEREQDWRNLYLFLALADQAAERQLQPALPLLLERASYGDPGETMRGLRHSLEAIVHPDWHVLTDVCIQAASYSQRGARLWAVTELGVLRNARARQTLIDALNDPADEVREAAMLSIEMLDQV
jgi:HEAT repeat protein